MSTEPGDAVAFLTMPWPQLLSWMVDPDAIEALLDHGEIKASYRTPILVGHKGWAWSIWKDGLHYERGDSWSDAGGWDQRPRRVIPWRDLRACRERHPDELHQILALAEGRGHPRSLGWRWFTDPHIICFPNTVASNLERERSDDYYADPHLRAENGYADRLNAWLLAVQIASDLWIEPTDLIEWAEALA